MLRTLPMIDLELGFSHPWTDFQRSINPGESPRHLPSSWHYGGNSSATRGKHTGLRRQRPFETRVILAHFEGSPERVANWELETSTLCRAEAFGSTSFVRARALTAHRFEPQIMSHPSSLASTRKNVASSLYCTVYKIHTADKRSISHFIKRIHFYSQNPRSTTRQVIDRIFALQNNWKIAFLSPFCWIWSDTMIAPRWVHKGILFSSCPCIMGWFFGTWRHLRTALFLNFVPQTAPEIHAHRALWFFFPRARNDSWRRN